MFYDAEIDSVITLFIQTDNVQSACHCDSDLYLNIFYCMRFVVLETKRFRV